MALLCITYPKFAEADFNRIQAFRSENDALYFSKVNPHITLVFSVPEMDETEFIREVNLRAAGFEAFVVNFTAAVVNRDAFLEVWHVFLVPDEGNGNLIRLHDRLYEGILFPHRKMEIDFMPHIGIGNSKDKMACKKMADEWNRQEFSIRGRVNTLELVKYDGQMVHPISTLHLSR